MKCIFPHIFYKAKQLLRVMRKVYYGYVQITILLHISKLHIRRSQLTILYFQSIHTVIFGNMIQI